MKKPLVASVIAAFIFLLSCREAEKRSGIISGRIDYQITYLNKDLDKKTKNILPTQMKLLFNEKEASNTIDGFMGMYRLTAVTNFNTRKCSTMLKIFDKHYVFKGSRDEQMCCFDMMEDMEVIETDETKIIAGFLCKKAIINLPSDNESFSVFYTDEITLKQPNVTNPYKQIKGVLMEFELKLMHLKMRFVADTFHSLDTVTLKTEVREGSKQVSRGQMTQILSKLLE